MTARIYITRRVCSHTKNTYAYYTRLPIRILVFCARRITCNIISITAVAHITRRSSCVHGTKNKYIIKYCFSILTKKSQCYNRKLSTPE